MDKKLINIVKGDINTAIQNGSYNRNTAYQTNIEFNTPTKQILLDGVPYSNPSLTKVTWQELKDLRDNNRLIAGSLYRITDYNCTTTQENTQSAGHQFDIVLLALSENKLAEEGWAMMHDNIYDVTFGDGVTKRCYLYYTGEEDAEYNIVDVTTLMGTGYIPAVRLTINEETKTVIYVENSDNLSEEDVIGNYFQNSNLSAWKVWYCLDNDKSRFAWADNVNGKGVIYRLIDEWNNDVCYDFKNIQFVRKLTNGEYDASKGTNTWVYTFNVSKEQGTIQEDLSIKNENNKDDVNCISFAYNNKIRNLPLDYIHSKTLDNRQQVLNNNVMFVNDSDSGMVYPINHILMEQTSNNTICRYTSQINNITIINGGNTLIGCSHLYLIDCTKTLTDVSDCMYIGNKLVSTEIQ